MKRVYVIENGLQDIGPALTFEGKHLVVLVLMGHGTLATDVDRELEEKRRLAQRIEEARGARGQPCDVLVEWGDREEIVRNALVREGAELLG
jgi:hypothetical protein